MSEDAGMDGSVSANSENGVRLKTARVSTEPSAWPPRLCQTVILSVAGLS